MAKIVTGMPDHEARFHEVRRLQLLNEPLELDGRLRFVAPDRIEKHTMSPQREDLVVDGGWVSLRLYERKNDRRFRIADDPVLQALLVTLLAILNGQPQDLDAYYKVEAHGDANSWTLRLLPATDALSARVSMVGASGSGNRLNRIEVVETTGDSMVMTIDYNMGG